MVTRYGQADVPREVSGRRADRRSAPAADFPRDVCLTVSRNHAVFLLSMVGLKLIHVSKSDPQNGIGIENKRYEQR